MKTRALSLPLIAAVVGAFALVICAAPKAKADPKAGAIRPAAAADYADGKLGKALILGQDTNASLFAPRPESAEEMEWHRQNLDEEIDLRKKAQAAIDAKAAKRRSNHLMLGS